MADDYEMTADDMPEVTRRPLRDEDIPDVVQTYLNLDVNGPELAALTFVGGLIHWDELVQVAGPKEHLVAMLSQVTPESRANWGDMSEAVEALRQLESPGRTLSVTEATGDPDVVYYPIFDSPEGFVREQGDISETPFLVTLVKRPSAGGWKIHAAGGGYVHPERVPHDR
jgi:hypothetical protein